MTQFLEVLLTFLFAWNCFDEPTKASLEDLPQTPFFEGLMFWQHTSEDNEGGVQLLKITTFPAGADWQAEQFMIGVKGIQCLRTVTFAGVSGSGNMIQLPTDRIKLVQKMLAKLEPSSKKTKLKELMFVSYCDSLRPAVWVTRTYDMATLPESLNNLIKVTEFDKVTNSLVSTKKTIIQNKKTSLPKTRKHD